MYRITRVLSVGPFASPERAEKLLAAGVTHVLNVSDAASEIIAPETGLKEVAWVPMSDSRRLPFPTAKLVLDALHGFASAPGSHVYVHCRAGLVRSPTILWLYLIALGISPREARKWIQERVPMANAGSASMVDRGHVLFARKHGLANFVPLARGEVIVPYELNSQGADAPRSE
jgi:protein-tyrosine phosphatase